MNNNISKINLRKILSFGGYEGNLAISQEWRFEKHGGLDPFDDAFDDDPRMRWCDTGADAYLLVRELESEGRPVSLLWDMSDEEGGWGRKWVVLTAESTDSAEREINMSNALKVRLDPDEFDDAMIWVFDPDRAEWRWEQATTFLHITYPDLETDVLIEEEHGDIEGYSDLPLPDVENSGCDYSWLWVQTPDGKRWALISMDVENV